MMNVVALCLVLSSLVTAGVWSPAPVKNPNENVIVKDGHQVVVVEFDKEDGNTKVSISPQETHKPPEEKLSHGTEDAKEKLKDIASAFGVAKETVAQVIGKAKETAERKTGEISDKAREIKEEAEETVTEKAQGAKDTLRDASHKAKETVSDKARGTKEAVTDASQKAKETVYHKAQGAKEAVRDVSEKAKDTVFEKVQAVEEKAKEMAEKVKQEAKTVLETSKTMGKHAERNVVTTVESAKEKAQKRGEKAEHFVEQAAAKAKNAANKVKEEGEKDLNEILRRGREVAYDVVVYAVSPRAVGPAMGVVHLLGFAAAFGMCLWVTFVSSYVLAAALPRQQFGVVQSKIYPVYFRTMAYGVALALVGHLLGQRKRLFSNVVEVVLGYNLLASLLMVLFNLHYLEPRATKVMFERMKVEKEEGRGESFISEPSSKAAADPAADSPATAATSVDPTAAPPVVLEKLEHRAAKSRTVELSEKLKKLNAYSSFLNILTLMLLTWHLVYLGQQLHVAC